MPQFTIAEAARAVGVDHAALYRYIKSSKLSLAWDEKGKHGVDAAELARVFPAVSQSVAPATAREEWMQRQIVGLQQRLLPPPCQGIIERIAEVIARLRRPKGNG